MLSLNIRILVSTCHLQRITTKTILSWMSWKTERKEARISLTQWMRMDLLHKAGRNRSIKEDQRMTIREETSGAAVVRGTCLIPLSIHISKLSTMGRHLKVQTLHNFKQAVAEVGLARSMLKQINKRKIVWTL